MTIKIERDETMPLIEQVRELTFARTSEDCVLDFIPAARDLGATQAEAETIDETLITRVMRACGAI